MIPTPYSWEQMVCMQRGYHVQVGYGSGTSESTMLWPDVCTTCGAPFERRLNDGVDHG